VKKGEIRDAKGGNEWEDILNRMVNKRRIPRGIGGVTRECRAQSGGTTHMLPTGIDRGVSQVRPSEQKGGRL